MKKKLFVLLALLAAVLLSVGCGGPKKDATTNKKDDKEGKTEQSVCGDGKVTGAETCDKKILSGKAGACEQPANCVGDSDHSATYSGEINDCSAKCVKVKRTCDAKKPDGFCPTGCVLSTDADCLIPPGGTCDSSITDKPQCGPSESLKAAAGLLPGTCRKDNKCTSLCNPQIAGSCGNSPDIACVPTVTGFLQQTAVNRFFDQAKPKLPPLPPDFIGLCLPICRPTKGCESGFYCNYDILPKSDPSYGKVGACVENFTDTCNSSTKCEDIQYPPPSSGGAGASEPRTCGSISLNFGGNGTKNCLTGDTTGGTNKIPLGGPCELDKDCEGGLEAKCLLGRCTKKCFTELYSSEKECESISPNAICFGVFSSCLVACNDTRDCDNTTTPNTVCREVPNIPFKTCQMISCESDSTPGTADNSKCSPLTGSTCQQVGTTFLCKKP